MQLELFNTVDNRQEYCLLKRYRRAVPTNHDTWLDTVNLFLAEQGDYTTSLGDLERVLCTPLNLIALGYTELVKETRTSYYQDWYADRFPEKKFMRHVRPIRTAEKIITYVYDI